MQTTASAPAAATSGGADAAAGKSFDQVLSGACGAQASSASPNARQGSNSRGPGQGAVAAPKGAVRHEIATAGGSLPYAATPVWAQTQIANAAHYAKQTAHSEDNLAISAKEAAASAVAGQDVLGGSLAAPAQSGVAAVPGEGSSGSAVTPTESGSPAIAHSEPSNTSPGSQTDAGNPPNGKDAAAASTNQQNPATQDGSALPSNWWWTQAPDVEIPSSAAKAAPEANSKTTANGGAPVQSGAVPLEANSEAAGRGASANGITPQSSSLPQKPNDSENNASARSSTPVAVAARVQFLPVQATVETQSVGATAKSSSRGTVEAAASGSGKQVAAVAPQSAGANHSGEDTQGKDANASNSDSAAAQTAGLAQAAVGGPLHAPAAANASAEAAAGPAAAEASAQAAAAQTNTTPAIAPRPAPVATPAPPSTNDFVQATQLYQRVGGAEMHVAVNTELLGSVDVHAVVRQSTVTATIGVQRPEVQTLLASDLPALQHALSERSLHVEQISVLGGSTGGQTDLSRHAPQNQQNWRTPGGSFAGRNGGSEGIGSGNEMPAAAMPQGAVAAGRLSIHV